MEDSKYNTKIHNSVIELNKRMNTRILPIVLKCELYILQKGIKLKRQRKNRKATNISSVIKKFRTHNLFIPSPNVIEIENSNMSIREVVEKITYQVHRLSQIDRVYIKG